MAHTVTRTRLKSAFPPPPTRTLLKALAEIVGVPSSSFASLFTCMEIAEQWIERAKKVCKPDRRDAVHALFTHLCPPDGMGSLDLGVYRMHVTELVNRALTCGSLRLGTDAEVIAMLHHASLKAPLPHYMVCAYEQLMQRGIAAGHFGDKVLPIEATPLTDRYRLEVEAFIDETKLKLARHTGRPA